MKLKTFTLAALLPMGLLLMANVAQAQQFQIDSTHESIDELGSKQQERLATAGLNFLKLSQSARGAGMADAYTSVADDISAAFWNPAGLADIPKLAWTTTYTRWVARTQLFSGALAYNTGSSRTGVLGISLVYLKPEDVEETTIWEPGGTGRIINAKDMALSAIYALRFTDKLSFGLSFSWVHEAILDRSFNTGVFGVGTIFHTGFRNLRVAMSLRNLGRDGQYEQVSFWMPLNYHMAISDELYGKKGDPVYLTVAFESIYAIDYDQRYHIGGELWLGDVLALRGGYKFNYDAETFSLGAGVKYEVTQGRKLMLDLSYTDFGYLLTPPLRLTLSGEF